MTGFFNRRESAGTPAQGTERAGSNPYAAGATRILQVPRPANILPPQAAPTRVPPGRSQGNTKLPEPRAKKYRASLAYTVVSEFSTKEIHPDNFVHWGDPLRDIPQGDSTILRIVVENPNGLQRPSITNQKMQNVFSNMQARRAGVWAFPETQTDWWHGSSRQQYTQQARYNCIRQSSSFASAQVPRETATRYLPGGVALTITDKWATRSIGTYADPKGRWTSNTLAARNQQKRMFICAYRPCMKATNNAAATTAWHQQEWLFRAEGHSDPNPRNLFITDLARYIEQAKRDGCHLVVMLDANEDDEKASSGVAKLISRCGLIDVHKDTEHGTPPATHRYGSKKIDFVLISPELVQAVIGVSILPLEVQESDQKPPDHRALSVDFNAIEFFGSATSDVVPAEPRRLKTTNPRTVNIYATHMRQAIDTHRLISKLESLQEQATSSGWSESCQSQYETIDRIMTEHMLAAEYKCPGVLSGGLPYSPALSEALRAREYWALRLKQGTKQWANQDKLQSHATAGKVPCDLQETMSPAQCWIHFMATCKSLRTIKKDAADLRMAFLKEQAALTAVRRNMDENTAAKAILAAEQSKKTYAAIRQCLNPQTTTFGLQRIDVPSPTGGPGAREILTVKEDIEGVLYPHTQARFQQHQETPFGHGLRQKRLGDDCQSLDSKALLDGTYDFQLEKLTDEAKQWLTEIRRKPSTRSIAPISSVIEVHEFIQAWSKFRESTSSSPSGRHYGHYKTAALLAKLPEEHPDYCPELATLHASMCSLPVQYGFAPQRWTKCIDAVLEKVPGSPRIEKLRIIMLYEADFNYILKEVWGRRLIRSAEQRGVLGTEQHGSRPGRQCTDAILEKSLIYEIHRLQRASLITIDKDARACYDRIIRILAMLVCIALGLEVLAAVCHNRTHTKMQHWIKLCHGLVSKPYGSTNEDPTEGTGQGSGASPGVWLVYSVSLLAAFRHFSEGMQMVSPYFSEVVLTIFSIFYVDDGMTGVNDAHMRQALPIPELAMKAQAGAQSWEKLLYTSGGALELTKCFAYYVFWDTSRGFPRALTRDEIPGCTRSDTEAVEFTGPVALSYGDSSIKTAVQTEETSTGRRTLGVRLQPAGRWNDEYKFRCTQSLELARRLRRAQVTSAAAKIAYHQFACAKIEWPLAVTEFTQTECNRIGNPVIQAVLPLMGFHRTLPREVVVGPLDMGGLGLHDVYVEQGIKQITTFIGHMRQESETSKLIQIEYDWCQLHAGTSYGILTQCTQLLSYLEPCWIVSLRDFMQKYNLHMDFTNQFQAEVYCKSDSFIMEDMCNLGEFTTLDLRKINTVRLWYQVTRVSEIATADGRKLRSEMLKGQSKSHHESTLRWPRQEKPPSAWLKLWSRALRRCYSRTGTDEWLRCPLGEWTGTPNADIWTSGVSQSGEALYILSQGVWRCHPRLSGRALRHNYRYSTEGRAVRNVPSDMIPADVLYQPKMLVATFRQIDMEDEWISAETISDTTFQEFVMRQPSHVRTLLSHCEQTEVTAQRAAALVLTLEQAAEWGTDGGLENLRGTFGFALSSSSAGRGQVPGKANQSSTRTELCAAFAILKYVHLLHAWLHIPMHPRMKATIHCDSQAAIARLASSRFRYFTTSQRCRANYDLDAAIMKAADDLSATVDWKWVRGHPEKRKKRDDYTVPEILNTTADEAATLARQDAPAPADIPHWPEQVVSVVGPNGRLLGKLSTEIRFACLAPQLTQYWERRFRWDTGTWRSVDTIGLRSALRSFSRLDQRRIQQLRCGWLPVNHRLQREDPINQGICASCGTEQGIGELETVDHLFRCSCSARRRSQDSHLTTLETQLLRADTPRDLRRVLLGGLEHWRKHPNLPYCPEMADSADGAERILQAAKAQEAIGWHLFHRGFIAVEWQSAFQHLRSQNSGDKWIIALQKWALTTFLLIWKERNDSEHGANTAEQTAVASRHSRRTIQYLYTTAEILPEHERFPFYTDLEEMLKSPYMEQQKWIRNTVNHLDGVERRQQSRQRTRTRAIQEFFTPRTRA